MKSNLTIKLHTDQHCAPKLNESIQIALASTLNWTSSFHCIFQTIVDLTNARVSYTEQLASLTQEFEKSECRNTKQSKVEEVLKKQVSELQFKLDSACQGRKAESEMAQEALTKSSQMERSVLELNAKLKALMDENADLKEQLYTALEHHTTKSCESENSKVSSKTVLFAIKAVNQLLPDDLIRLSGWEWGWGGLRYSN